MGDKFRDHIIYSLHFINEQNETQGGSHVYFNFFKEKRLDFFVSMIC